LLIAVILACGLPCACTAAEPDARVRFGGVASELTVSEVSDKTVRLKLAPLDDQGRLRPGAPSTILVPFPEIEKLRVRELTGDKEIRAAGLRVKITARPLTISVLRADGKLVQELKFSDAVGTNQVAFRTDAPVLGLGEGEQQFDRRGHYFHMRNGQLAPLLATHGATIPISFLLGTDGWAMFLISPLGEIDLRANPGCFLPNRDSLGQEPLDLFVISAVEPADALAEYIRLTGHPVMPPKWVLGYFQSHRTLAGPEEPLQIAKVFRGKKLPCDALIYLGSGYCTNGWNVANGTIDFNPRVFDRPAENLRSLHAEHFKVVLHVNQAPRSLFGNAITEASTARSHITNYWAWQRPVFALGVDGWWPDDGDELPIEARLARHRCYYEGPLLDRPHERPWSLHRNGYAGAQRYGGWLWSGDTQSRWATLAAHVPVGLNCSLSLTPFWGSDTGGFVLTSELTGELYTRWFQFSAFNPLFRSHGRTWKLRLPWGWNTGDTGPIETRDVTDRAELHNA
jgi:alpha-glucosidase/alpha-D-xyloside xylohydrolase